MARGVQNCLWIRKTQWWRLSLHTSEPVCAPHSNGGYKGCGGKSSGYKSSSSGSDCGDKATATATAAAATTTKVAPRVQIMCELLVFTMNTTLYS